MNKKLLLQIARKRPDIAESLFQNCRDCLVRIASRQNPEEKERMISKITQIDIRRAKLDARRAREGLEPTPPFRLLES